ncbi:F-box/FBD/LRR-repeat protein [Rhynchospora pubera]|uniref:F-box/FBD/LRR-repeat protein n=1 Tax=Rhynchospora pubera TaxID=906938 RepID=A0AAV8G2P3_9POAL|nr:F-box/FBD/LRR-repeat protein [Rhynchospora pubera]
MAGEDEDRISSLPSELKVSILARLEVKDAIRASALARSWRHLWTFCPRLRLGCADDPLGDYGNRGRTVASSWIERAHHVVSSLRGPLLHFELAHFFSSHQFSLLQLLLDLLLLKGPVKKLRLYCLLDCGAIHLPSFHSLEKLFLYGCRIVLPADFREFDRLSSLTLCSVQISNDHLHLLLHSSNNLTTFKAFSIVALDDQPVSIKLNLPLLRHLDFQLGKFVEKVEFFTPSLEQANFWSFGDSGSEEVVSVNLVLVTMVTSVVMVSSLSLHHDVLKYLSLAALPSNFTFPRLTCLKLFLNAQTMDKRMLDTFIWLLQSMPLLKALDIELHDYDYYTNKDRVDILMRELLVNKHDGISCLNRTLKSVRIKMHTLNSVMTIITLVKFLLLNARVLEIMKVAYWTGSEVDPSMLEVLQNAKVTTSSKAEVVISECNC